MLEGNRWVIVLDPSCLLLLACNLSPPPPPACLRWAAPCRDAFRRDYPPYFSAQQALLAAGASWDWRGTYRGRLQHDLNWKQGQLAAPVETLRSHTGWVLDWQRDRAGCCSSGVCLSNSPTSRRVPADVAQHVPADVAGLLHHA